MAAVSTCLALLAGFCFHGAQLDAQFENTSVGYALIVKTPSYEADTARSEDVKEYDWRHQPKVCAGQNCVRYHMSCTGEGDQRVCDYQIGFVGEAVSRTLRLHAASDDAIAKAGREISLWFGPDAPMLPLFMLQAVPNAVALVPCPAGSDAKLCNP